MMQEYCQNEEEFDLKNHPIFQIRRPCTIDEILCNIPAAQHESPQSDLISMLESFGPIDFSFLKNKSLMEINAKNTDIIDIKKQQESIDKSAQFTISDYKDNPSDNDTQESPLKMHKNKLKYLEPPKLKQKSGSRGFLNVIGDIRERNSNHSSLKSLKSDSLEDILEYIHLYKSSESVNEYVLTNKDGEKSLSLKKINVLSASTSSLPKDMKQEVSNRSESVNSLPSPLSKEFESVSSSYFSFIDLSNASVLDDILQTAIQHHESNDLFEAFKLYLTLATNGNTFGLLLTGISLRHGWGVDESLNLAVKCLEAAVLNAAKDLIKVIESFDAQSPQYHTYFDQISALDKILPYKFNTIRHESSEFPQLSSRRQEAQYELAISLFELGQCYRFGWGMHKSNSAAALLYRLSADLGDYEAQMLISNIYTTGRGLSSIDRFMSAAYLRMASVQEHPPFGASWAYKPKYNVFFWENFPDYAIKEYEWNDLSQEQAEEQYQKDKTLLEIEGIRRKKNWINYLKSYFTNHE